MGEAPSPSLSVEPNDLQQKAVENVVIIGSGPAGYTAAIYAARANLNPLLITGFQAGGIPGGQLMTTTHVENYPGFPDGILGPELMDRMKAQAVRWGTQLVEADAERLDLSVRPFRIQTSEAQTIHAQTLILATGASANRLGLPQEERFWSRGISACAICDGATPQFRREELAVVGMRGQPGRKRESRGPSEPIRTGPIVAGAFRHGSLQAAAGGEATMHS